MLKISKKRKEILKKINNKKKYLLEEAFVLIKKCSIAKFNESVDISIHLGIDYKRSDQIVRGFVIFPFNFKKSVKVLVFAKDEERKSALEAGADFVGMEDLIKKIKLKGIFFDVVVTSPKNMLILNSLGKILGPRGLMPNKKSGTLSSDIFNTVKNIKLGQVNYKSDKFGIINLSIGKSNFKISSLKSNFFSLLNSLKKNKPISLKNIYFRNIWVSSTMGIGVKINQQF
ncbi:50S ribosomal protein L1 [Candidatus Zinderia endosymbiont of Aphrophora alni]|uniref:50S ribosomal protein L1 n=1 Tax=Candidatus Zinderia endosymbiont of Aphrophora alni TaxID=3077951 RepID=UPI0030D51DEB